MSSVSRCSTTAPLPASSPSARIKFYSSLSTPSREERGGTSSAITAPLLKIVPRPPPPFSVSIRTVLGAPIDTLYIFGFHHCLYTKMCEELSAEKPRVITPFTSNLLKAATIALMRLPEEPARNLLCKSTIVYAVFMNFKRHLAGSPLVPLIFSLDRNDNPYEGPLDWLSKEEKLFTKSEMKRAFKLCYEETLLPLFRTIALRTFVFIKVIADGDKPLRIERIPPPWDASWNKILKPIPAPYLPGWRDTLLTLSSEAVREYASTATST